MAGTLPTHGAPLTDTVRHVGIVAKPGLREAGVLLGDLGDWLRARDITPHYEAGTAALAARQGPGPTHAPDDLPREVELLVVLVDLRVRLGRRREGGLRGGGGLDLWFGCRRRVRRARARANRTVQAA